MVREQNISKHWGRSLTSSVYPIQTLSRSSTAKSWASCCSESLPIDTNWPPSTLHSICASCHELVEVDFCVRSVRKWLS
ncbi:hypothetical protein E2C01_074679 [Portunus trituberculatus]|uniref:Uncharacterized protein n=1 Tax=Portunus trituberculatus TaxID=210409 RepID=A0A5B7I8M5_PORTR|nr:hypothetical protein [Portunus trituberculatus]